MQDALLALFDRNKVDNEVVSAFEKLKAAEPKLRRRDLAQRLLVSEAAIIDHQCGVQSIRLSDELNDILTALPSLGYVMNLTRNEAAVHERKGEYQDVKIHGAMGLVVTSDKKIDLRMFLSQWAYSFAVTEESPRGRRFSLQFFDQAGNAVQKVYLEKESNHEAYANILKQHKHADQTTPLAFQSEQDKPEYAQDNAVDVEKLRSDWANMRDVHHFFGMLKNHQVSREQSFRLVGEEYAETINPQSLEMVLNEAANGDLPIMCFVGNHGNIQIHNGPIKTVKTMGDWLNVLDPEFNLHLLMPHITSGWLIRKPTTDGIITSLEFYDYDGELVAQFFGLRKEGNAENATWRALAESTLDKAVA